MSEPQKDQQVIAEPTNELQHLIDGITPLAAEVRQIIDGLEPEISKDERPGMGYLTDKHYAVAMYDLLQAAGWQPEIRVKIMRGEEGIPSPSHVWVEVSTGRGAQRLMIDLYPVSHIFALNELRKITQESDKVTSDRALRLARSCAARRVAVVETDSDDYGLITDRRSGEMAATNKGDSSWATFFPSGLVDAVVSNKIIPKIPKNIVESLSSLKPPTKSLTLPT